MNPLISHISLYDLASLATLFVGIAFALLLLLAKRSTKAPNLFLSFALDVVVLKTGGLTTLLLPTLGPLLYFYVRQLTCPDHKFRKTDTLHFSLLIAGYWMPSWMILASVIAYLYLSHQLIENFYRKLKPVLMDRPRFAFRWLNKTLFLLALFCALSMFIDAFCIAIAFVLIGVAAEAILKPDSATRLAMPITDRSDAKEKARRLKEAVAANRLYEDAELTLATLAVKLMMHPHDLSRIINVGLDKNFSDFINEFRVREVVRKMQDPAYDRLTLLGIAYESGFNSQRTFHRVFKERTGKTPLDYKNSLEKGLPIDKLAVLPRIRPVILRSESPPVWAVEPLKRNIMIKNYLKIAWRNLLRHKVFSGFNIFGLATGMACSIIIFLWVQDELSFDRFNPQAQQIFRLTDQSADQPAYVTAPPALAYAIKTQIPAIKDATRIADIQKMITIGRKKFDEKNIFYADSSFLQIFNYPLLRGNTATALSAPNSVVLTETTAKKYFGSVAEAMGKTIFIDNDIKGTTLLVTGILKDFPANSHLQPSMLISMEVYDRVNNVKFGWTNFDVFIYFQLKDGVTANPSTMRSVCRQIDAIYKRNNREYATSFSAQPLTDIHLHSHFMRDVPGQGNAEYVTIFALAAIFIILIACINFINLATAISGQRAKEVGLRKTIGAIRGQLIAQFMGESLMLSFMALIVAVVLVLLLLPLFNQLADKNISFDIFQPNILLTLLGVALFTGIISGSYPAFFLASFNPVKALKSEQVQRSNKSFLRNGLVVLQFSISIILIVSTIVIYNQLQFIQHRDLGFNKDNLLYMQMPQVGDLKNNKDAMRAALAAYPEVSNFTFTDQLPTSLSDGVSTLQWPGMNPTTQVEAYRLRVDQSFAGTFDLNMVAGRFFSKDFAGDDSSFVVNEAALRVMNIKPSEAVGRSITFWDQKAPIIGVVKDFNFKSVQYRIEPLILKSNFSGGYVVLRTRAGSVQKIISAIQKSFHNVYGDYPFSYGFVDADIDRLYVNQQRMGKLFNVFSILSIIISCLGLFGLAIFAARQRIKEIGIRKVLGASETSLVALLSKDFIRLVLLSFVFAFPVAWWLANTWLHGFAYRIAVSWWIFALAGSIAMLIAFATVSYQAIKAAQAKPVRSLRNE